MEYIRPMPIGNSIAIGYRSGHIDFLESETEERHNELFGEIKQAIESLDCRIVEW